MSYATLMVHADLGAPCESLLRVTAGLATLFQARVIGVSACQPLLVTYGDGYLSPGVIEQDRIEIDRETSKSEMQFRTALKASGAELEWRSTVGFVMLSETIADQARAADLLITSPEPAQGVGSNARHLRVGELVMRIGRPVLVVPADTVALSLASVMVAWKDTRETRRAVVDALPLLKRAGHVVLVEVVDDDELVDARMRLADVAAWLDRHGIIAETLAVASHGDDTTRLEAVAREHDAGLIVAGAYGHSRVREWVLGGVTRDLLRAPGRCALLSH